MTSQHSASPQRFAPSALTRTLAWLRLCAITGQSSAVLVAALWMRMDVPVLPLLVIIGFHAVFAAFASWRLTQPWPVREWETIGHIAVDTIVLWALLYFTGGATNPFVTLLLMPIALGAAALTVPALLAVSALTGLAYLTLLGYYVPLPPIMEGPGGFALHVIGMAVNFVITAALLGFFINRLATAVRAQQAEVQRVRERALRDEGILAIATQAAGAAHELNTPLSTMRTLLPELRREHAANTVLADDLALLQAQVERCRGILREMVAFGKAQLSQEDEQMSLGDFVRGCLERFQLLRPEAELELELDAATADTVLRSPPGMRHALINLLNNAADASALRGSHEVALRVRHQEGWLELRVSDRGPGFVAGRPGRALGQSQKQGGLGLGLTLAEATAERLSGELTVVSNDQGAEVSIRLPLSAISVP
ncbi:MAG: ATP-binding protein [Dyella sp.]|uniref:ATP-binding protein n=1 Tax=Dyella sp. TaxID=1869338 RepID=UPI003F7EC8A0